MGVFLRRYENEEAEEPKTNVSLFLKFLELQLGPGEINPVQHSPTQRAVGLLVL